MTILEIFTTFCVTVMAILLFFELETTVKRIDKRTKRLEMCIDLILDRLEIDTPLQLSEKIKQIALDPKRKVEAIQLYREETGVTLKEAADAINTFLAQHPNPKP